MPLIIKDPRMSPEYKGTTNDEFTLNIDLATTILAAAGLEPLPSMMGRDMSDLYRNGGLKQAAATSQSRRKAFAPTDIRQRQYPDAASDGPEKYHSGSETSWRTEFFYERTFFVLFYTLIIFIHSPHLRFCEKDPLHSNPSFIPASEALVRKDYKYFYWPNFKYEQLFDLKNDPGELEDLFNSTNPVHQQKLVDMRKRFVELKMMAHSDLSIIL